MFARSLQPAGVGPRTDLNRVLRRVAQKYPPQRLFLLRYSKNARYDANFIPEDCWNTDANTVALCTLDEGGTTTASTGRLDDNADLVGGVRWVSGVGCDEPETGGNAVQFDGSDD